MAWARTALLGLLVALSVLVLAPAARATNYITAVGVQQFSCTIASGSTACTATINSTGSGAFILYGGETGQATTNYANGLAAVTLTNPTTITATRNTSTTNTVTVFGCIIDGDTTNLIKSVQYGTVSVASAAASGTATISAVTNANTAIHYLGQTSAITSAIANNLAEFGLSLSGTTVTAARGTAGSSDAATVYFVAIEFQGSVLNQSVQAVSASSSSSVTSYTATITSVVPNNTICIAAGMEYATSAGAKSSLLNGQLTNGTTFTVNVNTALAGLKTFNDYVVELPAGVLFSAVQRGTTTITAGTSNTSSLSPSVTLANAGISSLYNTSSATTTNVNTNFAGVVLTNGSTVTTSLNTAGTIISSWEVFEFPAFSGGGGGPPGNSLNAVWFGSEF